MEDELKNRRKMDVKTGDESYALVTSSVSAAVTNTHTNRQAHIETEDTRRRRRKRRERR